MESEPQVEIPEIKAQIKDGKLLVKILCEKGKGVLVKVLEVFDGRNLNVGNASAVLFGDSILHITVVAEMEGLKVKEEEIIGAIRGVLQGAD